MGLKKYRKLYISFNKIFAKHNHEFRKRYKLYTLQKNIHGFKMQNKFMTSNAAWDVASGGSGPTPHPNHPSEIL